MLTAIALDDEPPALKVIESFCKQLTVIDLQRTFTKPSEAAAYLQATPVDVLFLDIQMPSISGIDFYKNLPQEMMVIFTTAYSEYAVEGFNLSAIDYLLKPYTLERFTQAVHKAHDYYNYLQQTEKPAESFIFIRADYSVHKIQLTDILYIEGLDDYLKIHLAGRKPIVARLTMKAMLEQLPAARFVRVHRSFIVPLDSIEQVQAKNVMVNNTEIPIGNRYKKEFLRRFRV
jgi:DNA-binding LytR/AlgR family response regulator